VGLSPRRKGEERKKSKKPYINREKKMGRKEISCRENRKNPTSIRVKSERKENSYFRGRKPDTEHLLSAPEEEKRSDAGPDQRNAGVKTKEADLIATTHVQGRKK